MLSVSQTWDSVTFTMGDWSDTGDSTTIELETTCICRLRCIWGGDKRVSGLVTKRWKDHLTHLFSVHLYHLLTQLVTHLVARLQTLAKVKSLTKVLMYFSQVPRVFTNQYHLNPSAFHLQAQLTEVSWAYFSQLLYNSSAFCQQSIKFKTGHLSQALLCKTHVFRWRFCKQAFQAGKSSHDKGFGQTERRQCQASSDAEMGKKSSSWLFFKISLLVDFESTLFSGGKRVFHLLNAFIVKLWRKEFFFLDWQQLNKFVFWECRHGHSI